MRFSRRLGKTRRTCGSQPQEGRSVSRRGGARGLDAISALFFAAIMLACAESAVLQAGAEMPAPATCNLEPKNTQHSLSNIQVSSPRLPGTLDVGRSMLDVRCSSSPAVQSADAFRGLFPPTGEFGADLRLLQRFYTPPPTDRESNFYFDLWDGRTLRALLQAGGLTNNHTLFVNSHGEAVFHGATRAYGIYPHENLLPADQPAPHFSVRDLAQVMGAKAAAEIHNIVIAGCNEEGVFDSGEMRKHFVNATNIVHTAAGERSYQPMLFQALLAPSAKTETFYETIRSTPTGKVRHFIGNKPGFRARKLSPLVAELFLPGASKPFHVQPAGRELFESRRSPMSLAGASPVGLLRIGETP